MTRPATSGPGFQAGDLIWSPNGTENAWCILFSILSLTSWSFFNPATGTVGTGPQGLDLYKPDFHRRRELLPPKP